MTLNTRLQLKREATNINGKIFTSKHKESKYNASGQGRNEFKQILTTQELESQAQTLEQTLNTGNTCLLSTVSNQITIHALKVASRGRQLKDKQNKPLKDENGNIKFTPANLTALKVLQAGINDTSGILDDLRQSVTLEVWQAYTENKISIVETETTNNETGKRISYKVKLQLSEKTDKQTLRQIYNVVQNYLYSNLQKHYKRQYIPVINDSGIESHELVTKAMRNYEMGLQSQDKNELFQSLQAVLNESESCLLWCMYDMKQVDRSYRTNGKTAYRMVTRNKTIAELAQETGYTIQTVRTLQKHIKAKLQAIIEENNNVKPRRYYQNGFTSSINRTF